MQSHYVHCNPDAEVEEVKCINNVMDEVTPDIISPQIVMTARYYTHTNYMCTEYLCIMTVIVCIY